MHIVDKIIAHLDGYEKKELLNFIERQPKVNMELKLAKIMLKDDPPKRAEIKDLLYPPNEKDAKKNRDAFNSLIKQFTDRVFLWCIITRVESDKLHFGKAYSYLILGKFLIHRNALETAKEILTIGESFATKYRDYEVLEGIYSLWMDHADSMKIPVAELIKKRESNGTTYRTKVKLQNKYALQREIIHDAKRKGSTFDRDIAFEKIKKEFKLNKEEANDPSIVLLFSKIFRNAVVSSKDYVAFERYIVKVINRFTAREVFTPFDNECELEFQLMAGHAYYRNRKFERAAESCEVIKKLLIASGNHQSRFYPKYMSLRAGIASYTGDNLKAISITEEAMKYRVPNAEIEEWENMQLNLAVYHFQSGQFKKAHRALMQIEGTDDEIIHQHGKEWCMKMKMINLIFQYELGNNDISLKMLKTLREVFKPLLSQTFYQRADKFLQFVEELLKNPEQVATPEFAERSKDAQLAWPNYKEDIQAITFFCWLRSKIQKRNYYEVLLERLNEGREK